MPIRRDHTFTGIVQGVGFRAMVADCAKGLPITGWVRNEPDGSVRLLVEGEAHDLDALVERIVERRRDTIERVDRHELPARGDLGAFGILR